MVTVFKVFQHDFDVDTKHDDELEVKAKSESLPGLKLEKWWQITIQVSIPFFLAGAGTIGAGIILGHVEVGGRTTQSFSQIFISFAFQL